MRDYKVPEAYQSLVYLHTYLGDVRTVEAVCHIWNQLNWGTCKVRIKSVDEGSSHIKLTGKCQDTDRLLALCRYLTSSCVLVTYEPTIVNMEW